MGHTSQAEMVHTLGLVRAGWVARYLLGIRKIGAATDFSRRD